MSDRFIIPDDAFASQVLGAGQGRRGYAYCGTCLSHGLLPDCETCRGLGIVQWVAWGGALRAVMAIPSTARGSDVRQWFGIPEGEDPWADCRAVVMVARAFIGGLTLQRLALPAVPPCSACLSGRTPDCPVCGGSLVQIAPPLPWET